MRLFLLGLSIVVFAGCKSEESPAAGAIRVELSYATFRPGCLEVTAADKADPSRATTQELKPEEAPGRPPRSAELTVAVFREASWGRDLVVTGTAYEGLCNDPNRKVVATRMEEARVPESGAEVIRMDLRAEDLDDDGFVRADQGGSDCDDGDVAVRPGATESCNGKDDNCSRGEEDAPGAAKYFADADNDGYGNPLRELVACGRPAGYVDNNRDCNDGHPGLRPDQAESLCNGQDENCDGVADDTFNVGSTCATAQGCTGALACAPNRAASECVSSQVPTAWYVDNDGDGHAGTEAGPGCTPPVPGAVNTQTDCDDGSPFAFNGGTERCDRLDNDCDGTVDEGCGAAAWTQLPDAGTPDTSWRAVAAYAEDKAWVAGPGGKLAHVNGGVATDYPNCPGNWISAWASGDGRVFLGSEGGVLATYPLTATGCETRDTGRAARINGLVGFGSGANTTVFAVTSEGRVFRWNYPGELVEVTRVAANLRDVHGTKATNLLAVGAELVGATNEPRAFRTNPDGGVWLSESLPPLPANTFLRGVHVVHDRLAYAVGDNGTLLQRDGGTWSTPQASVPALEDGGTPDLLGVAAYGKRVVYVIANNKTVYLFNGTSWAPVYSGPWNPYAIDGVAPWELWVAGDQGTVIHWSP